MVTPDSLPAPANPIVVPTSSIDYTYASVYRWRNRIPDRYVVLCTNSTGNIVMVRLTTWLSTGHIYINLAKGC